jgi:hypothetical protein
MPNRSSCITPRGSTQDSQVPDGTSISRPCFDVTCQMSEIIRRIHIFVGLVDIWTYPTGHSYSFE